ncbi:MAG: PorV/PorQ family protein [Candidatus Desantisbacteria bacterium]
MRNERWIVLILAGGILACSGNAWADKSTAAHILEFGSGVRPTAMGEAFCGVADDINAISDNPSGIAWLNKKEISLSHDNYYQDIKVENISGIYPVEDILACVGLNVAMLRVGEMIGMDNNGSKIPNPDANDSLVTLSFAQIMDEDMRLGVGLGIKWIHQKIAEEKASGMSCDIGILYKGNYKDCPYTVGAVVQNIGEKMGFVREKYSLPLNLKVGVSKRILDDKFLCAIDLNKPIKDKIYLNIGGEYCVTDNIALRAGFNGKNAVDMGMSAGIGVKMGKGLMLDYSYSGYGELGNVSRVSVGRKFGNEN